MDNLLYKPKGTIQTHCWVVRVHIFLQKSIYYIFGNLNFSHMYRYFCTIMLAPMDVLLLGSYTRFSQGVREGTMVRIFNF